jgi:hypothetical protein
MCTLIDKTRALHNQNELPQFPPASCPVSFFKPLKRHYHLDLPLGHVEHGLFLQLEDAYRRNSWARYQVGWPRANVFTLPA